jgi:glycosyltransferase involved in cell wall biosynthesis
MRTETEVPLVTSILLVFNHADHVSDAFESFINQDYPNVRYIVSDDGSTDGSISTLRKKIAAQEKKIQLLVAESNRGLIGHLNYLRDHLKGKYFFAQGGDDLVSRDRISICVAAAEKHGASLVTSNPRTIRSSGVLGSKFYPTFPAGRVNGAEFNLKKMPFFGSGLYSTSALLSFPCLPPTVRNEDTIFPFLCALCGPVVYVDSPIFFYRLNPDGLSIASMMLKRPFAVRALLRERYSNLQRNYEFLSTVIALEIGSESSDSLSLLRRFVKEQFVSYKLKADLIAATTLTTRFKILKQSEKDLSLKILVMVMSPFVYSLMALVGAALRRR